MTTALLLALAGPRAAVAADDECGTGAAMGATASGTMDSNDINDWWNHTSSQQRRVTLSATGDLDLQVRAGDCQTVLCYSQNLGGAESCSVSYQGTIWIAVVNYPPGPTTISYTLNVVEGAECQNGVDDDGDGAVDFPSDAGCSSPSDNSEAPNPQCADGIDNDGDGAADYPGDTGCSSLGDDTESPNPQCSDGADNDGDGAVDYPADTGCANAGDDQEGAACPPTAGVVLCLTPGSELKRVEVAGAGVVPDGTHHVAGYVDVYRFVLPGGVTTSLPCVVLVVDAARADACAALGGTFVSRTATLLDNDVPTFGTVPGDPLVSVAICTAELTVLVGDIGVNSAPALALC